MCPVLQNGVLEKPTVAQFVKRFPVIYPAGSSLPFSQCGPYSKPVEFSPHPYNIRKNSGTNTLA
jgi:hypothetical protein